MACLDTEAHLDHRVHRVLQAFQVDQVCQATMETKEQRDREDHLGFQVWTDSLDSRVKRETEERKEKAVGQGETADHLDLQGLPDLQDRPSTTQQEMGEQVFQVEQDSRDQ